MGPLGEVETTMATSAQSLARPRPAWQLTKRALVGGDTEKVALEWANEQVWAGCTGQIAGQERSRFPQYWPFPASPRRKLLNDRRDQTHSLPLLVGRKSFDPSHRAREPLRVQYGGYILYLSRHPLGSFRRAEGA